MQPANTRAHHTNDITFVGERQNGFCVKINVKRPSEPSFRATMSVADDIHDMTHQ